MAGTPLTSDIDILRASVLVETDAQRSCEHDNQCCSLAAGAQDMGRGDDGRAGGGGFSCTLAERLAHA